MSKIKRKFGRFYWISPLCAVLVAFLYLQSGGTASFADTSQRKFTGEQLYRGLILCHGEVAELIPEIRDNLLIADTVVSADQLKLIEATQDRIVEAVNKSNPEFFDQFAQMVRSGNQVSVSAALDLAAQETFDAIGSMPEVQEFQQRMDDDPAFAADVLAAVQNAEGADGFAPADLDGAVTAVLANLGGTGGEPWTSLAVVIVAIGAIVAAVTFFVLSAYGAVMNVGAAVNVIAAIVVTAAAWVTATHGIVVDSSHAILHDQIVNSIAVVLAG